MMLLSPGGPAMLQPSGGCQSPAISWLDTEFHQLLPDCTCFHQIHADMYKKKTCYLYVSNNKDDVSHLVSDVSFSDRIL